MEGFQSMNLLFLFLLSVLLARLSGPGAFRSYIEWTGKSHRVLRAHRSCRRPPASTASTPSRCNSAKTTTKAPLSYHQRNYSTPPHQSIQSGILSLHFIHFLPLYIRSKWLPPPEGQTKAGNRYWEHRHEIEIIFKNSTIHLRGRFSNKFRQS